MTSWVYLFSKFTPEALLFEALFIFVLCGGYAGFWILTKRKMGVIGEDVPSGVVKTYLNELLTDAQYLRTQLFGLLADTAGAAPRAASTGSTNTVLSASDPQVLKKLTDLEARMTEQTKALERLFADRANIERELASAKSAGASLEAAAPTAASSSASPTQIRELEGKIKNLEGKLSEYSVIEDDLANLKRLQQENAQLKAQLAGQGTPSPAAAAAAPTKTEPSFAAAAVAAATVAATATPAPSVPTASTPQFENLVDQVEQSLKPDAASPAPVPAQPAPTAPTTVLVEASGASVPGTSTTGALGGIVETSDADLVAEFEKMLNG